MAISAYWTSAMGDGMFFRAPAGTSKTSTASATKNFPTVNTSKLCSAQHTSGQFGAYSWTTSDTIKHQHVGWSNEGGSGCLISLSVRVVSADGGTVRGILYEGNGPTALLAPGSYYNNRSIGLAGAAVSVQNNVSMQEGDRLVIETGIYYGSDIQSATTYLDDNASDLPENETATSNLNPWVEFSPTLSAYSPASAPTVTTTAISSITKTTATSGGNVTNAGGGTISARGVCWSTSANPTTADSKTTDAGTTGEYASSITSLTANTVYHVRAYATNETGTGYGSDVQFETDVVPTVTTAAITIFTHATATGGGNVTDDGGATISERGTCFSTSENPTTSDTTDTAAGTTGAYTTSITGLTKATLYHVRAYATNSVGTAYGSDTTFTTDTLADISDAVFTITEATPPSITGLSDTVVYAGQTIVITGTNFGAVAGYVKWGLLTASVSAWADTEITCLVPTGATAGDVKVTTDDDLTSAGSAYTMAVAPTVTTTAISAIAATTATSGGTVSSDGGATVTAHGVCWSTSSNPTTADSKTTDTADPTPFASSITGLTRKTTYHVRAYATNPVGTSYGSDVEFTTLAAAPTVSVTDAATSIEYTTAVSGGTITDTGGETMTVGVCWNTFTLPTTSNSKTSAAQEDVGSFTANITGLTEEVKYYVRAYATNVIGTSYGPEINFTADAYPAGALTTAGGITMSIGI